MMFVWNSAFDYLFILYYFLSHAEPKSIFCHRFECASQGVDWICGSDGQDYLNLCELERIRCFGVSVQEHAKGRCLGKHSASAVLNLNVDPSDKNKHRVFKELARKQESCSIKRWEHFKRSLTTFWRKDYFRKPRSSADVSLSIEKRVLHYNFDRMDTNRDEQVSSAEWKFYRSYERHPIRGQCAKDLLFRCDQDLNRQLSRIEWMQCLYESSSGFNTQWYHSKAKDTLRDTPQKKVKSVKPQKKPSDVAHAVAKQRSALHVDKKPCQRLVELSGNYSFHKFAYNTDCQLQPSLNLFNPICTAEKKLRFLQMLFSQFRTEMIFVGQTITGGMKAGRRQVATWKFRHLDTNNDHVIQRSEWWLYRQYIKQWDDVRKCARFFFRGCDSNRDGQIEVEEWNLCTVNAYEQAMNPPRVDHNPLLYLLKQDP